MISVDCRRSSIQLTVTTSHLLSHIKLLINRIKYDTVHMYRTGYTNVPYSHGTRTSTATHRDVIQ